MYFNDRTKSAVRRVPVLFVPDYDTFA